MDWKGALRIVSGPETAEDRAIEAANEGEPEDDGEVCSTVGIHVTPKGVVSIFAQKK